MYWVLYDLMIPYGTKHGPLFCATSPAITLDTLSEIESSVTVLRTVAAIAGSSSSVV